MSPVVPLLWPVAQAGPAPTATPRVYSWQDTLEGATQVVLSTCSAWYAGEQVAELIPVGGSVSADCRRATMRTCTLELAPAASQTVAELYAFLSTAGLELRPRRGFIYPDATTETRPLGHYLVDSLSYSEAREVSSVSVTCSDVSVRIQRASFTDPYQIASSTDLADGVAALLADRWPGVAVDLDNVSGTLAAQVTLTDGSSSDPWAEARTLMANYGYTLYVDAEGVVRATIPPDPASAVPSRIYHVGATALITKRSWSLPMASVRNGVIVTGEGSEIATPVRGEAWDTDPASDTYYLGAMGALPEYISSSVISTEAQAEAVARTRLALLIGRVSTLAIEQIVDASLAPLEAIAIEAADGSLTTYVVDAVTTPLSPAGTQSVTVRSGGEA